MIQLDGVSKVYKTSHDEVRALDNLSISVETGQFVAVRGHSGSGKSTLLALVGGLARPTEGRIVVAGHEISAISSAESARLRSENIGFVFQMFHLLPYLSVLDNVLVAARPDNLDASRAYASELLESFGLNPRRSHRPAQLSAGERQRVAMARALLNRPQLLLADEPTGNLDDRNAAALLDRLAAFHSSGGTILLVTHHENAAERAERCIALENGHLAEEAETASA
ncbi:MAG: ABC transporter ATP-binding protein [Pirellulaceae bacterium]